MKESINFYYNFNVGEVYDWSYGYSFKFQEASFYLVPLKRNEKELDDILEVASELRLRGVSVHEVVVNRYGRVISNIYNSNYVLLKPVGDGKKEYEIRDMLKINEALIIREDKRKLYHNSWASMWSVKVDYFEYQVHELGRDKKIILDSFSYYLGLAENAISYVNSTTLKYGISEDDRIVISHKRIGYPNYALNYENPLSFIVDLEVRDIASFVKSAFMEGEGALLYLKEALKLRQFTIYSLQMLMARLMYPTFYFDVYERVMEGACEEEELIKIIDKSGDYELFLKEAFLEISKYAPIERIEWLLKKEEL